MKQNLLIARAALERLGSEFEPLKDQLNFYLMDPDGTVTLEGEVQDPEHLDIHLGWFGRDVMFGGFTREYAIRLLKAPNLAWVQTLSAGLDAPFFKSLAEKGIRLCNSDAQAPAIAEYVVASVLYRFQGFEERRQYQAEKRWQDNHFRELYNANWLIIGYGNIGQRVGIRAKGFEANITGIKRRVTTAPGADQICTYEDLPDLLPEQDVVVLACALTDETRDLVDANFLARMKPGSVLVNIGRGDLVDEDALLQSLDSGHLDYAVLDVFRTEPLPEDSPFWSHDRVLVTPHSSNRGHGTGPRGDELFIENLGRFLAGDTLRNEVDMRELLN